MDIQYITYSIGDCILNKPQIDQEVIGHSDGIAPDGQVCEITPEMVGAGVDTFFRIDCVEDSPQEIVKEIYRAMIRQSQVHSLEKVRSGTPVLGHESSI